MNTAAAYTRLTNMFEGYAAGGATAEQIADAYHLTYRTFSKVEGENRNLPIQIAHFIENRAVDGTVWADAYALLAD